MNLASGGWGLKLAEVTSPDLLAGKGDWNKSLLGSTAGGLCCSSRLAVASDRVSDYLFREMLLLSFNCKTINI